MNLDFSPATLSIDEIRSRPDLCTLMHDSSYETHSHSTGIHHSWKQTTAKTGPDTLTKRNINKFYKIKVELKSKESNGQQDLFIMTHQEGTSVFVLWLEIP